MDFDIDAASLERQKLPFWARHSKEVKILCVVLLCGLVAAVVPFFINKYGFHLSGESATAEEGTCRLLPGFKMDCLPEFSALSLLTKEAETRCAERGCCWDNSTTQQVNCFHQLPSHRYSAKVHGDSMSPDTMSGELEVGSVLGSPVSYSKYSVTTPECGHVIIGIGVEMRETAECPNDITILAGCPGFQGVEDSPDKECPGKMFTLELTPYDTTRSSIARTHFGPIMMSDNLTEISLYLPGPRIFGYGMDKFIWSGEREVSHFNFGDSSSVHLPFILGMHPTQDWYMLWLETGYPGEQIISKGTELRPLVTWRTMGGPIKVHLLTGKSLKTLLNVAQEKMNSANPLPIPPYWTLGYHLCRSVGDPRYFTNDVKEMKSALIPFDSDCIDEQLIPTAFELDDKKFPTVTNLFGQLEGKDILLPLVIQRDPSTFAEGCVAKNSTSQTCFEGKLYGERVIFPDPFSPSDWMTTKYKSLLEQINQIPIAGWHVHDTSPTNDLMQGCSAPRFTPRGMNMTHSLCHDNHIQSVNSSYISHHSLYSLQVSRQLSKLSPSRYQYVSDYQIGQASMGGFLGSPVAATWPGMAASLREVLMLGLAGQSQVSMPVCGATSSEDMDEDDLGLLCLRWFQLAAYMPSLRSWYMYTDNLRMPYRLKEKTYRNYITWAMEKRYKMLPYLRTLQKVWIETSVPLVRPMFLEFTSSEFIDLWEQFMVGPDLVVAPSMSKDDLISVHLPQGVWYDLNSGVKYISPSDRNVLTIKPKLYQIPVFQRGGTALILYDITTGTLSAKEASSKANFELKIGLDCGSNPRDVRGLQSCSAQSSSSWLLSNEDDFGNFNAFINVTTIANSGNINIKVAGHPSTTPTPITTTTTTTTTTITTTTTPTTAATTKTSTTTTPAPTTTANITPQPTPGTILSVISISGISLEAAPTITLPDGTMTTATCEATTTRPCISWQPEQEILMVKNVGIVLAQKCGGAEGCIIGWQ